MRRPALVLCLIFSSLSATTAIAQNSGPLSKTLTVTSTSQAGEWHLGATIKPSAGQQVTTPMKDMGSSGSGNSSAQAQPQQSPSSQDQSSQSNSQTDSSQPGDNLSQSDQQHGSSSGQGIFMQDFTKDHPHGIQLQLTDPHGHPIPPQPYSNADAVFDMLQGLGQNNSQPTSSASSPPMSTGNSSAGQSAPSTSTPAMPTESSMPQTNSPQDDSSSQPTDTAPPTSASAPKPSTPPRSLDFLDAERRRTEEQIKYADDQLRNAKTDEQRQKAISDANAARQRLGELQYEIDAANQSQ